MFGIQARWQDVRFSSMIDRALSTPEQKADFPGCCRRRRRDEVAGGPITAPLGNGARIGGLKVTAEPSWFAIRPSGTEDLSKIYAESFRGPSDLRRYRTRRRRSLPPLSAIGTDRASVAIVGSSAIFRAGCARPFTAPGARFSRHRGSRSLAPAVPPGIRTPTAVAHGWPPPSSVLLPQAHCKWYR